MIELGLPSARTHNGRGDALCDLGRFDEALAAYDGVLGIDPLNADSHLSRGRVLCDYLGRPDEALAEFNRTIELDPRSATAHLNRGVALRRLRRVEESLAEFDRAIDLDPQHAETHNSRGTALRQIGRLEDALAAYNRAIELDPRNYKARYNSGNALAAKGEVEAAIAAYGESIWIQPQFAEAHCNLGNLLMRDGRFQEAIPSLLRGHELGSKRPDWAYPSAKWVEDAERKAQMEVRLDRVLSRQEQPRDAVERIELALTFYERGRHEGSARMYTEAFADDAGLAEDLVENHRYNAACSGALAAAAGGAEAAEWRGRSLAWLRADLAAREKAVTGLVAMLEHWKKDPDFASVRERIEELPEPERAAWRGLWADVDLALAAVRSAAK